MVTLEEQEYLKKYLSERTLSAETMETASNLYLKSYMAKTIHKEFHKDIFIGLYAMAHDDDVQNTIKPTGEDIYNWVVPFLIGCVFLFLFWVYFESAFFEPLFVIGGFFIVGCYFIDDIHNSRMKKSNGAEFKLNIGRYNALYESLYSPKSSSSSSQNTGQDKKNHSYNDDEFSYKKETFKEDKSTPYGEDKKHPDDTKYWNIVQDPSSSISSRQLALNNIDRNEKKRRGEKGTDLTT